MRYLLLTAVILCFSLPSTAKDQCPNPPLNINQATIEQLEALPYIGEKKAKAIMEYRNKKKKFNRITQLMDVDGIGSGTLKKLQPCITIKAK